jgi:hypothetical protein
MVKCTALLLFKVITHMLQIHRYHAVIILSYLPKVSSYGCYVDIVAKNYNLLCKNSSLQYSVDLFSRYRVYKTMIIEF